MKLINSIKRQAVVMFVGFTLGISLLYFVMAVVIAFMVEDVLLSRLLQQEANYLEQVYAQSQVLVPPRMDHAQVYPNKETLPQFVQQALAVGITDNEIFTADKEHYHIVELNLGPDHTGYLLAEVSRLLGVTNTPSVFNVFLFGLVVTLVIAVALAIKMASLTVKPVMSMVEAIETKQPLPKLPFELGYLSVTMQKAFDDLSDSLQREKDFTGDVSHELRTPLTILNNTITLAEQRGLKPEELEQLRVVGDQMLHTIEVLLALARAEHIEQQPCLFEPILEQAGMEASLALKCELQLKLEITPRLELMANVNLLRLLVLNLINNALVHGTDQSLVVKASSERIVFHNLTDNNEVKPWANAGVKGEHSQGIGQGLYLVTRILQSLGWQYQLEQAENQFSLTILP